MPDDKPPDDFPARFKQARRQLRLTAKQCGEILGMNPDNVYRIERGIKPVALDSRHRYAVALGIPPSFFDERLH